MFCSNILGGLFDFIIKEKNYYEIFKFKILSCYIGRREENSKIYKKKDAYMALPEKVRCFASPLKQGKIIFIDEKTIIFSSERRMYPVFESYCEYVQLKQKIKSDEEKEMCL